MLLGPPVLKFGLIKAAGASKIFLNWTAFDGNSPIAHLELTVDTFFLSNVISAIKSTR